MQNTEYEKQNKELRKKIASLAAEYADEKVPYVHRGTSRRGCDCTGLLVAVIQELGYLSDYVLREYPPDWNVHAGASNQIIEELSKYADEIPRQKAATGDVAVMRFGRCPAHCGIIITDNLIMAHALSTNRHVKKSVLRGSVWQSRWIAAYRMSERKLWNG